MTLIAEDSLKGADMADKAVADGAALGPLHGVPFSNKDSVDTGGVLTQRGSKLFAGNIPGRDATRRTIQSGRRHSAHEDNFLLGCDFSSL